MRSFAFVCATLVALSFDVGLARADCTSGARPSESDVAEAHGLFAAGESAVSAGRWADAVQSFRRAYDLSCAPSALFNTAFALRALGRYREALDLFERVGTLEGVAADLRAQASSLGAEVRARIAVLVVDRLEGAPHYTLRVDGSPQGDTGARPVRIELDPGRHTLEVSLPGFVPFEWQGALEDGAERTVGVELVPAPHGGGTVFEEAWFWVVVGVVVLGGGGVILGFVLDDEAQLRPESGMPVRF